MIDMDDKVILRLEEYFCDLFFSLSKTSESIFNMPWLVDEILFGCMSLVN